jgi:predicted MPP superfamily phosphohydrolase
VCDDAPGPYSILCAHDPVIFPHAAACGYDLVLAGHLHGGQCVLGHYNGRMYPAGWFFTWNGDRFTRNSTTMLVSKGLNDTLPIRWNCPREVILCMC